MKWKKYMPILIVLVAVLMVLAPMVAEAFNNWSGGDPDHDHAPSWDEWVYKDADYHECVLHCACGAVGHTGDLQPHNWHTSEITPGGPDYPWGGTIKYCDVCHKEFVTANPDPNATTPPPTDPPTPPPTPEATEPSKETPKPTEPSTPKPIDPLTPKPSPTQSHSADPTDPAPSFSNVEDLLKNTPDPTPVSTPEPTHAPTAVATSMNAVIGTPVPGPTNGTGTQKPIATIKIGGHTYTIEETEENESCTSRAKCGGENNP